MISETELAYAAGLLDGEAWIGITHHRQYHRLDVVVNMCDLAPILWLHERFGGHVRSFPPRNERWSEVHRIQIQGRAAAFLLSAALPYLIVKRSQAELALRFIETSLARGGTRRLDDETIVLRESMKTEMHRLNARGADRG